MNIRQSKLFIAHQVNRGATYMLLSLLAFCFSCTKESLSTSDNGGNDEIGSVIVWNVYSADNYIGNNNPNTRALVEDYTDLRNACTASELYAGEKIGVYGAYTLDGKSEVIFDNTQLWWWEKENGNSYMDVLGNQSFWNYEGENRYWVKDANYDFRAYFPMSRVTLQPGSGANKFLIVYDTQVSQFDLMVASRSIKSREENPVQLLFDHALAAVSFDFQFVSEGVSDELTACWLENAEANGLYTSSTLNYEAAINWPQSTSIPVDNKMYYWEPSNPLPIGSENAARAYTSSASSAENGSLYTGNNGWLLIIPQTTKGPESLKLCFKTNMGVDEVYSVGLPAATFDPGHRYTFHIKISSTNIDVKLTIKDWNERKSSYDIDFNK